MFHGDTVACFSVDSFAEVDQQAVYPTKYTNSSKLRRLPPYKLNIKLGAPVMLLRNIHVDTAHSHCNGTHYIVRHIRQQYINIQAMSYYFPRNPLSQTDAVVKPLDNLCLTDINSPRSKCTAKPQSHFA